MTIEPITKLVELIATESWVQTLGWGQYAQIIKRILFSTPIW